MLSFSTCWNSGRHTDGEAVVDEILAMGFNTIEISHGLKVSLLPGIRRAFADGRVRVSGVHNFCPSPVEVMIDAPDCYEFTSHRPYDRERALNLTFKSLEFAQEFAARYLVLHLGTVPMRKMSDGLTKMLGEGKQTTPEFVRTKVKMIKIRESLSRLYCGRAREALKKIQEAGEKMGVSLAVESRSSYEQVPTEREMRAIMDDFPAPWVGYWHDFGHVQLKANLGLLNHYDWLAEMSPRLLGCHLHDVQWPARDHRVPFQGTVEFDRLLPLVPYDKPIVWELSHSRKREDIVEAREVWLEKYGAWC